MRRLISWLPRRWLVATAAVVVLAAALLSMCDGAREVYVTAHFDRAVGVYPGSDVRVLGVRIGTITEVVPEGRTVRVGLRYSAEHRVPADAIAVAIAPSVVSDRYVQLAPVYRGGPVMADGADIPRSRTASPVELDEVYGALDELSVALGPEGANADGALSRLVDVGAANLTGNGAALGQSVADLSRAVRTLSEGRADLVGVIRNLQVFTTALARNDREVRRFNDLLAQVSGQLAAERTDLATALSTLATALGQVASFVRDNRAALRRDVSGLAEVTSVLVRQRAALAEFLDVAPTALGNLNNAYNASSGTLDTRNQLGSLADPDVLCGLISAAGRLPALDPAQRQLCQALAGRLRGLPTIPGVPPPGAPGPGLPAPPPLPVPSLPPVPVPPLPLPVPSLPVPTTPLPLPTLPLPLPGGG
jgi:phospholipid/cholesterol/gamma-HCH transport system substrate-binding protein